ncbi:MAG: hypothetical protein PHE59_00070 [Patescibacteria group bacterium]|nr:hypothetical protein [Patescibacteria group bacterium]MDD5164553.1 hypothetical protein [Patescibacteria group bacterium]MDD5534322.1 hypothetical protein [Patescibacteria group bacterium]
MKNQKSIFISLLNAIGVAVYVIGISFILRNGDKIFSKMDNFLAPVAFLLLFVLSAAITGMLVLGKPLLLYSENRKSEAIKMFFYTIGWLFLITLITFIVQIKH